MSGSDLLPLPLLSSKVLTGPVETEEKASEDRLEKPEILAAPFREKSVSRAGEMQDSKQKDGTLRL